MEHPKVDLLRDTYDAPAEPRKPVLFFGRAALIGLVFALSVAGALVFRVASGGGNGFSFSLLSGLTHLIGASQRTLKGEDQDRVNILLLGIGGGNHDGPELTDTIMLASYKPSTGQVALMSIPRDMAVPIPGYGTHKINAANAFGEAADPGSGPALAEATVSNVFGVPIDYYVRVDFSGFAAFIDDLGGVDIDVDRSFTDSQYPILGKEYADCGTVSATDPATGGTTQQPTYDCRYEVLHFTQGWTHMDGATALKYVRSRHGTNGEASDFARSRRQQKVLLAVRGKLLSASTLLNPAKLDQLRAALQNNISTDLRSWEILRMAGWFQHFDASKLVTRVLDDSPESPLYATSLDGAYVLLPKNDDWQALRNVALDVFDGAPKDAELAGASASPPSPLAKVEVQNGTNVAGLALHVDQLLTGQGFDVVRIGNAPERSHARTVVYDLTDGRQPTELRSLSDYLKADVAVSAGGWLAGGDAAPNQVVPAVSDFAAKPTGAGVDFLVVLGQNSADLVRP